MPPILLDRYREVPRARGAGAARSPETVVDHDARRTTFYTPFEGVNRGARLVLVGITPGPTQRDLAYAAAQRALLAGEPDEAVLSAAKRAGAFGGGTMRPNLLRMLDAFGFADVLGIGDVGDLWGSASNLLHATSVVPHAAFTGVKPFAGRFEEVLASPALRASFERDFVPSLAALPGDVLYVALGPTPLAALDWCTERGVLRAEQVLGAFAHPSMSSGSQVAVYLGQTPPEALDPRDPVLKRVSWLLAAAGRVRASVEALHGGQLPSLVPHLGVDGVPRPKTTGAVRPRARSSGAGAPTSDPTGRVRAFAAAGYARLDGTKKVTLFKGPRSGREVYLINETASLKAVVHPDAGPRATSVSERTGGTVSKLYHNENLRAFPRRQHGGQTPVHYGLGVAFETVGELERFLTAFDGS